MTIIFEQQKHVDMMGPQIIKLLVSRFSDLGVLRAHFVQLFDKSTNPMSMCDAIILIHCLQV